MKPDLYKALKDYACQSFEETHAGLYTLLTSDKNFSNHVERKYRLKQYEQEGEFFMTANERWFHLIGFIDALIWFYRGNLLKNLGYGSNRSWQTPIAVIMNHLTKRTPPTTKLLWKA